MTDPIDKIIDQLQSQLSLAQHKMREKIGFLATKLKNIHIEAHNEKTISSLNMSVFITEVDKKEIMQLSRKEKRVLARNYKVVHPENLITLVNNESFAATEFVKSILIDWPSDTAEYFDRFMTSIDIQQLDLPFFLADRKIAKINEILFCNGLLQEIFYSVEKIAKPGSGEVFENCWSAVLPKYSDLGGFSSGCYLLAIVQKCNNEVEASNYLAEYEKAYRFSDDVKDFTVINNANVLRFSPYISTLLFMWSERLDEQRCWDSLERLIHQDRIGDPRADAALTWRNIERIVPNEFDEFKTALNRADLDLFFEYIYVREDRKKFWSAYLPLMRTVKIFATRAHYKDLANQAQGNDVMKNIIGRVKRMRGYGQQHLSILIIELNGFFIAEGSDNGAACHIFTAEAYRNGLSDLLRLGLDNYEELRAEWKKQKDAGHLTQAEHRFAHQVNWQRRAEELLGLKGLLRKKKVNSKQAGTRNAIDDLSQIRKSEKHYTTPPGNGGSLLKISKENIRKAVAQNKIHELLFSAGFDVKDLRSKGKGIWVRDSAEFRKTLPIFNAAGLHFERHETEKQKIKIWNLTNS